jgi:hypothetical protein
MQDSLAPVQDRDFEIIQWTGAGMESAVNFFPLGMSVSAYGSIRVPRVGSTSWALLELAKPLVRKGYTRDAYAPLLCRGISWACAGHTSPPQREPYLQKRFHSVPTALQ